MKHAIKNPKHKHKTLTQHAGVEKSVAPRGPNWAMLVVVAVFTGLVTFGLCEYYLFSKLPVNMLGHWVIMTQNTDPANAGLTMDFSCNGSVVIKLPGSEDVPGTVRVDGDRVDIMIVNRADPSRGRITMSCLLIALTDKYLELEPLPMEDAWFHGVLRMERPTEK